MLSHLLTWSADQAPGKKRMIALLPTTMTYASTSAQHGPYTQPLLKSVIALLSPTISYAITSNQHVPHTQPLYKRYDRSTTFYYVIC